MRHFRVALYDVTSGTADEVISIARAGFRRRQFAHDKHVARRAVCRIPGRSHVVLLGLAR